LTFVRELTTRYLEVSPAYRKFQAAVGDREDRRLISGLTARLQQAGAGPDDLIDLREVADDITRLQDLACAETPDPGAPLATSASADPVTHYNVPCPVAASDGRSGERRPGPDGPR
jgi:hypothetical protein